MPVADFSLKNKVAIVTGASRGIGEAIARGFVEHGATVIISSRKQEGLDKVAKSINENEAKTGGGMAIAIACHGGKPEEMATLFEKVDKECDHLDILVNNAATNPYFGPALDNPLPAFDKTIEVNLRGYFIMMQMAAKKMLKNKSGSIINMASIAGLRPGAYESVYGITKAGVISMTQSFAKELGPSGIRVNAIAPGVVETYFANTLIDTDEKKQALYSRTPLKRHGQPNEIAGAAIYLASNASSYQTGTVTVIDGGVMA